MTRRTSCNLARLASRVVCLAAGVGAACGGTRTPAGPTPTAPDLVVSPARARSSARIVWEHFATDHCAIVEGCVGGPGWRRLLRFETFVGNVGAADLVAGFPPAHPELFELSPCHGHHHFERFAEYRLYRQDGREAGRGHKQAFCLEDSEKVSRRADARQAPFYSCSDQGISSGWADSYPASLDCQWVDVTGVPPGVYTLAIAVNPERRLAEADYENNTAGVTVVVPGDPAPPVDMLAGAP